MSLFSWLVLIAISFILIALGAGVFVFLTFFFNDGTTPGISVLLLVIFLAVMSVIVTAWAGTPVIQATAIAASLLFLFLTLAAHFFLPYIDNKDVIKAFRPIILFCLAAGLLIVTVNLAKIFVA